jgi:Protein of unknown function (DUF3768)
MTPGVAALGEEAAARIIKTIAVFDDFCHANDPHEEHDFGSFEAEGHTIFFKIDYLDRSLNYHSPDPADVTRLAGEVHPVPCLAGCPSANEDKRIASWQDLTWAAPVEQRAPQPAGQNSQPLGI